MEGRRIASSMAREITPEWIGGKKKGSKKKTGEDRFHRGTLMWGLKIPTARGAADVKTTSDRKKACVFLTGKSLPFWRRNLGER